MRATDCADEGKGLPRADETLAQRVHECGDLAALQELMGRYWGLLQKWIDYEARHQHLQAVDLEDAKEEALLALTRAAQHYQRADEGERPMCSFRTFLERVVQDSFRDRLRRQRLQEHCYGSPLTDEKPLATDSTRPGMTIQRWYPAGMESPDPVAVAEEHEVEERLQQALAGLEPTARWLVDQRQESVPWHRLAAVSGCSPHQLRRLLRKSLDFLAAQLGQEDA